MGLDKREKLDAISAEKNAFSVFDLLFAMKAKRGIYHV
jgi:hypothetical protein